MILKDEIARLEGRNVEKLKGRRKHEKRRSISKARRPPFMAILCMKISDSGVLTTAAVRFRVTGGGSGIGIIFPTARDRVCTRSCRPMKTYN